MKLLLVGIDPGASSSPTGFVAIEAETRSLVHYEEISSPAKDYRDRYRDIAGRVHELLEFVDPEIEVLVTCEAFVLRGKAGEILARLTGAIMAAVPGRQRFGFVFNTTMKKIIGGHGKAEKPEVARGVIEWLSQEEDKAKVAGLIATKQWDITDAAGLAIAGYLKDIGKA